MDENIALDSTLLVSAPSTLAPVVDWSVYPNPAQEMVSVSVPEAMRGPVDLQLLDATGRVVRNAQTQVFGQEPVSFNLEGLPGGIYHLRLQAAGKRVTGKVVKR